ncbi:MAG: universal stress protein [Thermodesulfobacteriota bacterium]
MAKKILIALDDSENARRAVDFVADGFDKSNDVTLLSVVQDTQTMCAMNSPELTPYFKSEQNAFCSLEDKKKQLIEKAAEAGRHCLIDAGFDENRINVKAERRSKSVAKDIINEADSGYDLVVIGRKGVSGVQEFLFGSVSQKVLHGVKSASVLIVT